MLTTTEGLFEVRPLARESRAEFLEDVLCGLARAQKELPCKWLYDARGSALFERICQLEEYYPTRVELAIMEHHAREMAALLGPDCALVEYGSGSSLKTRLLLQHLRPAAYVPVDISGPALTEASDRLARAFPQLPVLPVCGDFTKPLLLPLDGVAAGRRCVYFPGSTIGNFHKPEMVGFLASVARQCGPGGGLLLGVDLRKERDVLERAYDDAQGVTASFDLNVLVRANRELGADFRLDSFRHEARWDERQGRMEMHLVSTREQTVHVGGEAFRFDEGESIWTESSYKYDLREFAVLAALAGWRSESVWTDHRAWFSVQYLTCA
ncbi:L-histidine N(alpha)-methyltransferase [Anaeromyxobacter diazotrophicus]|uniref:Dimethylhistidine N-methyltransferase n=1 Tax=Anaeromyxobacter diazotrophicus TaxID=2590199 RepID=A0A7I9VM17_9BACT|nr:L-histidine N(alpha)-methyltransferase [Anaeromyxobacter diazotrophicus]GEJ57027.1 dimethylhistidine N-methyltransferase [Anaeromyxobacter diazotrophicus]